VPFKAGLTVLYHNKILSSEGRLLVVDIALTLTTQSH
jgi:hypothetical protein